MSTQGYDQWKAEDPREGEREPRLGAPTLSRCRRCREAWALVGFRGMCGACFHSDEEVERRALRALDLRDEHRDG